MSERIYKHQCKECDTKFYIEDLKLVSIARCPKCNADAFYVDEQKIEQNNKYYQDMFDAFIYGLKPSFTKKPDRPVTERVRGVKDILESDSTNHKPESIKPLLVIELLNEISVPKVYYNGEEITLKQNVFFNWDTDTSIPGGLTYAIEHHVTDEKYPVANRIERRIKGHAAD